MKPGQYKVQVFGLTKNGTKDWYDYGVYESEAAAEDAARRAFVRMPFPKDVFRICTIGGPTGPSCPYLLGDEWVNTGSKDTQGNYLYKWMR